MDPRVEEGGGEPIGDDAIEDGGASLQRVLRHFLPKKMYREYQREEGSGLSCGFGL
jgi:hypothetical protein